MFRVIVNVTIEPGTRDRFLDAIRENAVAAVRDEPGCVSFDVCEDTTAPDRFVLIETYDDEAAFDEHRNTPHFARWAELSQGFLVDKGYTKTQVLLTEG